MEKTIEMLIELSNEREFPRPRTPEEEAAWLSRMEKQKETLRAAHPEPTHVKLTTFDEDHHALIVLEFSAFPLEVRETEQGTVTKFSNGCVLTQRKQGA